MIGFMIKFKFDIVGDLICGGPLTRSDTKIKTINLSLAVHRNPAAAYPCFDLSNREADRHRTGHAMQAQVSVSNKVVC